jgi:hypothetical protein
LVQHKKFAKKAEAMTVKIKKSTKADYKNVPDALMTFEKLRKLSAGIKRLHD